MADRIILKNSAGQDVTYPTPVYIKLNGDDGSEIKYVKGGSGGGGGGGAISGHRVRFIDFDGTVVDEQYVEDGADAEDPGEQDHASLSNECPYVDLQFQGYTSSLTNILYDIDIGYLYTLNKTYIYFDMPFDDEVTFNCNVSDIVCSTSYSEFATTDSAGNVTIKVKNGIDFVCFEYSQNLYNIVIELENHKKYVKRAYISKYVSSIDLSETSVESVVISDNSLTSESATFTNCRLLKSISTPMSHVNLSFTDCTLLKYVCISQFENLDSSVFRNCSSLEFICHPSIGSLMHQDAYFEGCTSLKELVVTSEFANVQIPHNFNLNKLTVYCKYDEFPEDDWEATFRGFGSSDITVDKLILVKFRFIESSLAQLRIKEIVCNSLVAFNGFAYCERLEYISIPKTVEAIGNGCFEGCQNLKTVDFSNIDFSKLSIDNNIFGNCENLSNIIFPANKGPKTIPSSMFDMCGIKYIDLSSTAINNLEDSAFSSSNIHEIKFPNEFSRLGNYVFQSCNYLEKITISSNSGNIELGEGLFNYCENLHTVVFGVNQNSINGYMFENCTNLTTIVLKCNEVVAVNGGLFVLDSVSSDVKIYVNPDIIDDYKTSPDWEEHADKIFSYTE